MRNVRKEPSIQDFLLQHEATKFINESIKDVQKLKDANNEVKESNTVLLNDHLPRIVYGVKLTSDLSDLSHDYHDEVSSSDENVYPDDYYFNMQMVVLDIKNEVFLHVLEKVMEIKNKTLDSFCGAMLSLGNGEFVNLFHPLAIEAMIEVAGKENSFSETRDFKVLLYFNEKSNYIGEKPNDKLYKDIEAIHRSILSKRKIKREIKIKNPEEQGVNTFVSFEDLSIDLETGEPIEQNDYMLVPVQQLQSEGLVYPYYGTIIARDGQGWNLAPMMSSNIGAADSDADICTSSGDSHTVIGIAALNSSNADSALNSNIICPNYTFQYVKTCIEYSSKLWLYKLKEEGYEIDIQGSEKKSHYLMRMSRREFNAMKGNEDKTLQDYLKYMKEVRENELTEA